MRKITVYSNASNSKKEVITTVSTWGELVPLLGNIYNKNMKAVVMQSRNTLDATDAILPSGDFTLMLIPTSVKSGVQVPDLGALVAALRTKINDAFDEIEEEINDGDYQKSVNSSKDDDLDQLEAQARDIARSFH